MLAFLAFGESLSPVQLGGGAFVVVAVLVLSAPARRATTARAAYAATEERAMAGSLDGKVALVTGASRGAGRGTAVALGEAGATVYCTGRTTREHRSEYDRPETIEETAELVDAAGGRGIAVAVDHLQPDQVRDLVARIDDEQGGLDVLVNDIWGGEKLAEWDTPIWEHDLDRGLRLLRLVIDTHLITSHFALALLIRWPGGLVVEMTDGTLEYNAGTYRLSTFYDLAKASVLRLAFAQAHELAPHGCTAVALTPGWMRSEMMLEIYGVTEDNWREATVGSPHFVAISETPRFVGLAVEAWPPNCRPIPATAARSPPAAWRGSMASPISTAPSPTAGAIWSRSRTAGSRPTRRATADEHHRLRHAARRSGPAGGVPRGARADPRARPPGARMCGLLAERRPAGPGPHQRLRALALARGPARLPQRRWARARRRHRPGGADVELHHISASEAP